MCRAVWLSESTGATPSMAPVPARDSTDSRERDTSSPVTVAVICWEPMLEMLSVMPVVALWVMETRITTAMTPMMMPSMVRKERILWLKIERRESLAIFRIIRPSPLWKGSRRGRRPCAGPRWPLGCRG